MGPGDSCSGAPPWRADVATGLALSFVLDVANISRADGDLVEPLVFAAIVEANQAVFRNDPELGRRYTASGEALPDELRRPISISAVAQSLGIPFETVRRKVQGLLAKGTCVATPAGVYVPREVITAPRHAAIQVARAGRLWTFHQALAEVGFFGREPPFREAPPLELKRSVNRLLSQYALRSCARLVELAGGVMDGFVLLGLWVATAEGAGPNGVSARIVATRLDTPYETVRRHLLALEARGCALRGERGWTPAAPPGREATVAAFASDNAADLKRLFARLGEAVSSGVESPA